MIDRFKWFLSDALFSLSIFLERASYRVMPPVKPISPEEAARKMSELAEQIKKSIDEMAGIPPCMLFDGKKIETATGVMMMNGRT